MKNPYYNADKLNLELLSFDESNMSYEYNTLCFWATPDGRIYSVSDSGCSCPTPFENYEGENVDHVLKQLERVGSVEQAESIFDSWKNGIYREENRPNEEDKRELTMWVKQRLKF